ncbi:LANO_0F13850g1_1 [Lachancea nothofagi CBS 11611]|uniref:LANO_0F13850g1_1 n=1 Tax=Lachancea nothofagi CBS 11611 TaxID=1266666 RepID=A0A1G4KBY1_9SACH|nr:LANO_0F13850g1_1 [Lachancea nothofagi CBS 11611]
MPKLEEIDDYDDIDNLEMDLAEIDANMKSPVAPRIVPEIKRSQDEEPPLFPANNSQVSRQSSDMSGHPQVVNFTEEQKQQLKKFQVLYPCYFDKNRSHKQGRRVPVEWAVENPLAQTLADAVSQLQIPCVIEGHKCHPQDFGNPGRIRLFLKDEGLSTTPSLFQNKRMFMKLVSKYMKEHPTTLEVLKDVPMEAGAEDYEPRKVPRVKGFVMNDIVPIHSPFSMGHPMVKSIYEAPAPVVTEKPVKMPKNKYKMVRR